MLRLLPADAVSEHSVGTPGGRLAYTATAGTLAFYDQSGEQSASVFYTAYVAKNGAANRPLTFVFNGGPGAASAFLHLGLVGPRILDFGADAHDATLVEIHQRAVFNLSLRMVGNAGTAEDATQEAFISAYRGIRSFRGTSFRAWLMRIAANASTDELRRRARRPALSLDAPPPGADGPIDVADPAAGPEAQALSGEQRASVQAALLKLPDDQRLAVVMCDIEGFTYDEIGETMRCSIGTVKSRIARGREKLRAALLAEGNK